MGEVILTMKDIDKSFPGVHALDHVNFEVKRGEVHALMGENGAGKSTLMKVLTGIYQKDSGSITYKGQEIEFHNTKEAQDAEWQALMLEIQEERQTLQENGLISTE